jgi:hypothetical protein
MRRFDADQATPYRGEQSSARLSRKEAPHENALWIVVIIGMVTTYRGYNYCARKAGYRQAIFKRKAWARKSAFLFVIASCVRTPYLPRRRDA